MHQVLRDDPALCARYAAEGQQKTKKHTPLTNEGAVNTPAGLQEAAYAELKRRTEELAFVFPKLCYGELVGLILDADSGLKARLNGEIQGMAARGK